MLAADSQGLGAGAENSRSTGVDGPAPHFFDIEIIAPEPAFEPGAQMPMDQFRHSGRETHLETVVANSPLHGVDRIGNDRRAVVDDAPPRRAFVRAAADDGSGAIGKQSIRYDLLGVPRVLMVQTAKLNATDQRVR